MSERVNKYGYYMGGSQLEKLFNRLLEAYKDWHAQQWGCAAQIEHTCEGLERCFSCYQCHMGWRYELFANEVRRLGGQKNPDVRFGVIPKELLRMADSEVKEVE